MLDSKPVEISPERSHCTPAVGDVDLAPKQHVDELVENGVFADRANGKPVGKQNIHVPVPVVYQPWLLGREKSCKVAWLEEPRNAFRPPVQVHPGALDGLITRELLDEVAVKVARPGTKPSAAAMDRHAAQVARSEARGEAGGKAGGDDGDEEDEGGDEESEVEDDEESETDETDESD